MALNRCDPGIAAVSGERDPGFDRWPPSVWVEPWSDPITEAAGAPSRSGYVEKYWTSVLGPTQVLMLRLVAEHLDTHPDGFEMSLADASIRLGVSPNGGRGALRALYRLERYRLASAGHALWAVRRAVPVLSRQQLIRLPHDLRASHSRDARAAAAVWDGQAADRAARAALVMAADGESREAIARRLEMMRVPPAACAEASKMAVEAMAGPQTELDQPHARRAAEAPAMAGMGGI
ncbi:hypothetical protein [Candidatus Poriferisocius sp.]|uniref:hypothetical protein n=1 Tax=Candidatus Poriferisocius sp. TaxID=3101276 RepID=UPI003B524556